MKDKWVLYCSVSAFHLQAIVGENGALGVHKILGFFLNFDIGCKCIVAVNLHKLD